MLEGYGVERPISAIRVRVAGLGGYGPEAQSRLLEAASALQSLGYTATIVAGSSPQDMPVLVSGYALPETTDRGGQVIGDLGVITQPWSRLGAVIEADTAVSATSVALLAICILAVGVLLAVVQLGAVPARRTDAGVLRELGWRRGRIARWYLAEEAVAILTAAIVGAIAIAVASVRQIALGAVIASLAVVVVTSMLAVAARRSRTAEHAEAASGTSCGSGAARDRPVLVRRPPGQDEPRRHRLAVACRCCSSCCRPRSSRRSPCRASSSADRASSRHSRRRGHGSRRACSSR